MTTQVPLAVATGQRCGQHLGKVRCQLRGDHEGPHAAAITTTYITWKDRDVHYWRRSPAAPWLVTLPWIEGCGLP
jgi:hypothetical protein